MQHTIRIDNQQKLYHNNNMKILDNIKKRIELDMNDRVKSMHDTANDILKQNNYCGVSTRLIKSFIFKRCFYTTPC